MEKKCEFCHYWVKDENILTEGECRIKPPQAFLIAGPDRLGNIVHQMVCFWPRTKKELWCGEFKPRINLDDLV